MINTSVNIWTFDYSLLIWRSQDLIKILYIKRPLTLSLPYSSTDSFLSVLWIPVCQLLFLVHNSTHGFHLFFSKTHSNLSLATLILQVTSQSWILYVLGVQWGEVRVKYFWICLFSWDFYMEGLSLHLD